MTITSYKDFVLLADDVHSSGDQITEFTVQVFQTPARQSGPKVPVAFPQELNDLVLRFGNPARSLDKDPQGQDKLARQLGDLLLPEGVTRQLFRESMAGLHRGEGLRLRLRGFGWPDAPPWEFAAAPRSPDVPAEPLFLDPRLSVVWDDWLPDPADRPDALGTDAAPRLVYAAASPEPYEQYRRLTALPGERAAVERVFTGSPRVQVEYLPSVAPPDGLPGATADQLVWRTPVTGQRRFQAASSPNSSAVVRSGWLF
jgi:hypothetical protein